MEVERDSSDVLRVPGGDTNIADSIFVDLVNRHIQTNVISCCMADILHDGVVSVSPHGIMPLPVTVQTKQDQIRFGKINRKCPIGDNIHDQESHLFCFDYQVTESFAAVLPQKRLSTTEEQNAHTHIVELSHLTFDLLIGVNDCCDVIYRTVLAFQIASVSHNDRSKYRLLFTEQDRLQTEPREIQKR